MNNDILALIDFEKIDQLLEGFNKTTGFVTAIIDLEGNVLSKSGWRSICTDFHCIHAHTAQKCIVSDTELANQLAEDKKYHVYKCLNGLVDVAVPIVVNGEHIANLFSGQFFFEEPDREFFKKQAHAYGFDSPNYLKALSDVPVMSEERVKVAMDFLLNMTSMIVDISKRRVEKQKLNNELRLSKALLEQSQYIAHLGSWELDLISNQLHWSPETYRIFGLKSTSSPLTNDDFIDCIHPDDKDRVNDVYRASVQQGHDGYEVEHRIIRKDTGETRYLHEKCVHVRDANGLIVRSVGMVHDITESKQAQLALQQNEEMMRISQSVAHICSYSTCLNAQEIAKSAWVCSPEFYTLFGIDETYPHTIAGWAAFIHPDFREELVAYHEQVIRERKSFSREYKIVRVCDGAERWVHGTGELEFNAQGEPVRMFGAIQDITTRKQIEKEFLESEINFRRSISESPVGIRIVTVQGDTIYANKAFLDIFDFDNLEEFTRTPAKARYTAESFVQHQERKRMRKNGIELFNYEISIVCKNKRIRNVKVYRKEVLWNGVKHYQIINVDITEQRQAEDQLRKLSKAVEQSPDAICITNPEGCIEYVNPKTLSLTGYTNAELLNQHARIFSSGEKPKEEYAQLWQTIQAGNVWSGELHNKKKNGDLYWEYTTISPIFDAAGVTTHYLSIKEDITERKRTEMALSNSERELRKFASHLQHVREEEKVALAREIHDDLGQILVALKIEMGLLKQKIVRNSAFEGAQGILEKFDRLVSLADNTIKTTRRIMNGLRPGLLEIQGLIEAIKAHVLDFEERYGIQCEFTSEMIEADMNLQQKLALYRIVQEALNNIAKHSKASKVHIQLRKASQTLILQVNDNGVGFDIHSSGRSDSYGMIGMKERVVLLGGKLEVLSELGSGTCVALEMPILKA